MRSLLAILLLVPVFAAAQGRGLDACLGSRSFPSSAAVAEAWKAALRGEAHPERKLPSPAGNPCIPNTGLTPTAEVLVLGCSADESTAVVDVGGCVGPMPDDSLPCGAALLDLKKGAFTTYLPAGAGQRTEFRFAGNVLARSAGGGLELRFGKALENSKAIPVGRLIGPSGDPQVVLVAIGARGHERLASFRAGNGALTYLSPPVTEVRSVSVQPGGAMAIVTLEHEEGADTLLVVELSSGQTPFKVEQATRWQLSPDGQQLVTTVEEQGADGGLVVINQLQLRNGKTERLTSPLHFNGTLPLSVAPRADRAALGGTGVVELLAFAPLRRVALVKPFGESSKVVFHSLRWRPDGTRLLAFAGEYLSELGKMNNVAVLIDTSTGQVIQTWRDAVPAGGEPTDLLLRQNTGTFAIQADGGTLAAGVPTPPAEPPSCESRAEEMARPITARAPSGILIPVRR